LNKDGCCHSDGRAETGSPFKESAKAKRDQQELQSSILSEPRNALAQNIKESSFIRQLVKKDHVENDPTNGKQTIRRAVDYRAQS